MRIARSDVECIKEPYFVFPVSHNAHALSPDTYNHMFVTVHFETAEPTGSYFEISQVKF